MYVEFATLNPNRDRYAASDKLAKSNGDRSYSHSRNTVARSRCRGQRIEYVKDSLGRHLLQIFMGLFTAVMLGVYLKFLFQQKVLGGAPPPPPPPHTPQLTRNEEKKRTLNIRGKQKHGFNDLTVD